MNRLSADCPLKASRNNPMDRSGGSAASDGKFTRHRSVIGGVELNRSVLGRSGKLRACKRCVGFLPTKQQPSQASLLAGVRAYCE